MKIPRRVNTKVADCFFCGLYFFDMFSLKATLLLLHQKPLRPLSIINLQYQHQLLRVVHQVKVRVRKMKKRRFSLVSKLNFYKFGYLRLLSVCLKLDSIIQTISKIWFVPTVITFVHGLLIFRWSQAKFGIFLPILGIISLRILPWKPNSDHLFRIISLLSEISTHL
jgi:hypothetical protein